GPAPWMTLPPLRTPWTIHRYDLIKESITSHEPLRPLMAATQAALQSGNQIWVVGNLQHSDPSDMPGNLSPAPDSPSGWYAETYLDHFRIQFDDFLRSHAETELMVIQPLQGKNEHAGLSVFHGWKASSLPRARSDHGL